MAETQKEQFSGQIKVAARIIDLLSSGLYPNPAACLKELINNAYDADATRVDVFVKPDADQIIIRDDGHGFTKEAFVEHFSNVSESKKRDDGEITKGGRSKIGMIGIGFIAANELCEEVEVFSTCKGSKDLMHVTLNFHEMSKSPNERKKDGGTYEKADYEGNILTDADKDEHYTELYLKRVKGESRKVLTSTGAFKNIANNEKKTGQSLYGLLPETVYDRLSDTKLERWEQFDFYSMTMLQIALNVPIQYPERWHPELDESNFLQSINNNVREQNFSVFYDGLELRKPIVLRKDRKFICDKFEFEGEYVSAKGYFFAAHGTLLPRDLQGLLIRIRGSAVNTYHSDFLGYPQSTQALFQNWTTCEIYASDKLEEAMNIDRATFRDTHPAFVELREELHNQLHRFLKRVHDDLYLKGAKERRETKTQVSLASIQQVTSENIAKSSPRIAKEIEQTWLDRTVSKKEILNTYTPAEVLEMVSETAIDILPKPLFEKLIRKLNAKFFQISRR